MKEIIDKEEEKEEEIYKKILRDVKQTSKAERRGRRRRREKCKWRMEWRIKKGDRWKFGIRGILDAANVESNKISGRRYDPITGHDAIITTVGSDFKVLIGDSGDCISNDPPISPAPSPSIFPPSSSLSSRTRSNKYVHT